MRTRFRPDDADREAHHAAVERHVVLIALALMTLVWLSAIALQARGDLLGPSF
jgi:hypothetical protein